MQHAHGSAERNAAAKIDAEKLAVDTAKIGAVCAESRCPPFTGARGVAAKIESTGAVFGESLCPLHWS